MQIVSELAEKVNSTNYAAMSYNELVTINFAFLLALGEVKPLMEKKRAEEMDAHTHEYVAKMNNYGASKTEILASLEKEAMRETPYGPLPSQDVDEQTPTSKAEDNQDKGEDLLALPEPENKMGETDVIAGDEVPDTTENVETAEGDSAASSSEEESVPVNSERKDDVEIPAINGQESGDTISMTPGEQDFVEEALDTLKALPAPNYIDVNAPYYVDGTFAYGDSEKPGYSDPSWRNMGKTDLEAFRSASVKYEKHFLKHEVLASTDDYLVINESMNSIRVRLYHFPEQDHEGAESITPDYDGLQELSEDEIKWRKKWITLMKKAIKQAKELSFADGTDANTPFYDRYKFGRDGKILNLCGDRVRCYEDADTLSDLMPSLETYARLFKKRSLTVSKDNCVANVFNGIICLVLFNIPSQKKKRGARKKSEPAAKDNSVPEENPLIAKAVEMTKALPVGKSTDANDPYFIQYNLAITEDGALIPRGNPFSKNVKDREELAKERRNHERFAKRLKANYLVSNDNYTAFFWNDSKSLMVFYYNAKDKVTPAA